VFPAAWWSRPYQQLTAEGYLASYAGGFTQVAAGPAQAVAGLRLAREIPPRIDLSTAGPMCPASPRRVAARDPRGAGQRTDAVRLARSGVRSVRTAIAVPDRSRHPLRQQPDQVVGPLASAPRIARSHAARGKLDTSARP